MLRCMFCQEFWCCFALDLVYCMSNLWMNWLNGHWFAPLFRWCVGPLYWHIALHHAMHSFCLKHKHTLSVEVECRPLNSHRSFQRNMMNDFILSGPFYDTDKATPSTTLDKIKFEWLQFVKYVYQTST